MLAQTQHRSRYVIGIDLGTTNSAVSYVDTAQDRGVRQFRVPQLIGPGEVARRDLLPSFCYLPASHELPPGALALPWAPDAETAVGEFARDHGSAVPGRLVTSAKSWLAHGGVDRTSGILPWGGDLGDGAVSPVHVSRLYLAHIRAAWDAEFGDERDEEGTPCVLPEQLVVLTVPASFDEAARELTVQAAREAGYEHLVLLEEPLAAFYDWLRRHEQNWQEHLREGETVLVADVGGGTTDFSLIDIEQSATLRRTAVGEHLLLGGDNIDMALARDVEAAWQVRLPPREWSILCQQCRQAKERILQPAGPDSVKIGVATGGSSIVGNMRSALIQRDRLLEILLDGFFPETAAAAPGPARRGGMREMGLPFAADPAVTRHLLAFLRSAAGSAAATTADGLARPHRVLFNGGALLPSLVRQRLTGVLGNWCGLDQPLPELESQDLNLAVSRGAAYYGLVRRGEGVRVRGGIARAYFLEVHGGEHPELLCVMPRDTEEGQVVDLHEHQFALRTNRPVQFPLACSATRLGDKAGDLVHDRDEITDLPPLQTVVAYGKRSRHEQVNVRVKTVLNEVGTLDVWCETTDGQHRYPLTFDLRAAAGSAATEPTTEIVVAAAQLTAARDRLQAAFAGPSTQLSGVARDLEAALDLPRRDWGVSILRPLADTLLACSQGRLRNAESECRWLNLIGFCVRPGFGAPADEWRARELWKLWHAGPGARKPQVLAEWWTCWRRVAGGLRAGQQQQMGNVLLRDCVPRAGDRLGPRKAAVQEAVEMWRCLGALERLPAGLKEKTLAAMLAAPAALEPHHWWVVARLGARQLLHGPADAVIPAPRLTPKLPRLFERAQTAQCREALFAVANTCRICGVRGLDLPEPLRREALDLLAGRDVPEEWREQLLEFREESREYQGEVAGDSLPLGLALVQDSTED